jgi:nitrate/TMAO reductase-like tetraheme cytochrome c subunit
VTDISGAPIAGAQVRIQATQESTLTDDSGSFELSAQRTGGVRFITAWKEGYLNGGDEIVGGKSRFRIVLKKLPQADCSEYEWAFSRQSRNSEADTKACEICHPDVFRDWELSAHAESARNPLFLAAFSGKLPDGSPTGGPGYRLDFPNSMGNCVACHVPAQGLTNPFNSNPAEAEGVAAEGIFCDFCHKIRDARVDDTGGRPGVISYSFLRPARGEDIFFGQLDDVVAGPDAFHPLYRDSRYCAPCHHGKFWNVLAYSEFAEWQASSYAKRNIHCQDCHMKLETGARRFALEKEGGVVREAATLSSHMQFGLNDAAFMRSTVRLSSRTRATGGRLVVDVSIENVAGGHHIPTGSPMRNMILIVRAADSDGRELELLSGERIPDWAGKGPPEEGCYAGLPGKGFAKILVDTVHYPADPQLGRKFERVYPAPYWRPVALASDNRIAAEATDRSQYVFELPPQGRGPYTVNIRLVYRRTFKSWGDLLRVKDDEMELAAEHLRVSG